MDNIRQLPSAQIGVRPGVDGGGGGGDDGRVEERLRDLERAVSRIDATLSTLATREDMARLEGKVESALGVLDGSLRGELHKAISEQTWKLVTWTTALTTAIGSGLVAVAYYIGRHVQ